jgi:hypothetical protein
MTPAILALILVVGLLWNVGAQAAQWIDLPVALLQGLDKITARVSTFEAQIGDTVRFGTFEIVARTCQKRPPEEQPESAAFLEIVDMRPDMKPIPLFSGWMFASSPALSAVEHPVYDVWLIDCTEPKRSRSGNPQGTETLAHIWHTEPSAQLLGVQEHAPSSLEGVTLKAWG